MTDTQIYRLEVARIMDARKSSRDRFMPLLRQAIIAGMVGILCVLMALAAAAIAVIGYAWPGAPVGGALRIGFGLAAVVFAVVGVQAWIRHARLPGEIMELPGYTRAEFQRLTELNRKIRGQVR
jgi:hypothetical protein